MKRALIVHPVFEALGGNNSVVAWTLEALRDDFDLTLFAWRPPDLEAVNRYFGTSLSDGDFWLRVVPRRLRRVVDRLPVPGALLRKSLVVRLARHYLRSAGFDVVLSTDNEADLGRPLIQYVHFPAGYLPRPDCDYRRYHRLPGVLPLYRWLCRRLSRETRNGVRRNLSLVNSAWTGERLRECYGIDFRIVHPPVVGDFPPVPWSRRADGFVCIGRFSPEKELEKVMAVLARVRRRGHDIRCHLAGSRDHSAYTERVLAQARRHGSWIEVHLDLPHRELVDLVARNRYGIHGMVGEHFGIAVAEMQRAGCVVFVPHQGGPVEIVGGDQRQLYDSADDAVEKIDRVLGDRDTQESLRLAVSRRRELYSTERFTSQMRELAAEFESHSAIQAMEEPGN